MQDTSHIPDHWKGTPPAHGLSTEVCRAAMRRAYGRGVYRLNQRILDNPERPLKPHHVTTLRKGLDHARQTTTHAPMRRAVITALLKYTEARELTIIVADSNESDDIDINPTDQRAMNLLDQLCDERDEAAAEYEKHKAAGTTPDKDSPAYLYIIHDPNKFKPDSNALAAHAWRQMAAGPAPANAESTSDTDAAETGASSEAANPNDPYGDLAATVAASRHLSLVPPTPHRLATKRMRGNLNLPKDHRRT